jgi:hypothetical protein
VLAAEAKGTIARILEGLPDGLTKQRLGDSEIVRRVSRVLADGWPLG